VKRDNNTPPTCDKLTDIAAERSEIYFPAAKFRADHKCGKVSTTLSSRRVDRDATAATADLPWTPRKSTNLRDRQR